MYPERHFIYFHKKSSQVDVHKEITTFCTQAGHGHSCYKRVHICAETILYYKKEQHWRGRTRKIQDKCLIDLAGTWTSRAPFRCA